MTIRPMKTWTKCFPPEHLTNIFSNHQALQHLILSLGFRPICSRKPHRALRWMEHNGSESEQTKNRSLMSAGLGPRCTQARQGSYVTQADDDGVWGSVATSMPHCPQQSSKEGWLGTATPDIWRKAGNPDTALDFKCWWLTWDFSLAIWAKQNALGPNLTYSPLVCKV